MTDHCPVSVEMLAFQLNDAFTVKRQQIHEDLQPLRESIEAIDWLLANWEDAGELEVPEGITRLRLIPRRVPQEALQDHGEYLREIYTPSVGDIVEAVEQYLAVRAMKGKDILGLQLGNIELQSCDLDYIQDRSESLQEKADAIGQYLEADGKEAATVPEGVTVAVRYCSKEEVQALIAANKATLPLLEHKALSKEGETEEEAAERKRLLRTVETMKTDNQFLKSVVRHWDERKKVFLKHDKWSVKVIPFVSRCAVCRV